MPITPLILTTPRPASLKPGPVTLTYFNWIMRTELVNMFALLASTTHHRKECENPIKVANRLTNHNMNFALWHYLSLLSFWLETDSVGLTESKQTNRETNTERELYSPNKTDWQSISSNEFHTLTGPCLFGGEKDPLDQNRTYSTLTTQHWTIKT